eukprot:CCRYP_014320-RA/>CCRYP_014320-RA protein AED:0.11 eAED:0.11 QI:348/0.5/0.66/1/1/1/3/331/456
MSPKLEAQTSALDFALTVHPVRDDVPTSGEDGDNTTALPTATLEQEDVSLHRRIWQRWCALYTANSFLILILCAILLAYAYPPLGAVYVAPQITATWIAVIFIFMSTLYEMIASLRKLVALAGMAIQTKELSKAFTRFFFNVFVNVFNFGVVSGIVYGFSRFMLYVNALPKSLADGMTICATLPVAPNMVQVLTNSAGGDEAAAIFNAAFGNLVGVFLTPALILFYLGATAEIKFGDVFFKLGLRVVLPIVIGQVLRNFFPPAKTFVRRYKKYFKRMQEWCLVFIVYTVFCKTFSEGSDASTGDVFIMIALQLVLLCFVMVLAWCLLRILFRKEPKLQAMGLFGCTQKTVAMGVPLINAIYESNPLVGLYTLPLLIWHPMQLVLGTAIAPRLADYVKRREDSQELNQMSEDGETESEKPIQAAEMGEAIEADGIAAPNKRHSMKNQDTSLNSTITF